MDPVWVKGLWFPIQIPGYRDSLKFQVIFVQCILLFPRVDKVVHRGCLSTKPLQQVEKQHQVISTLSLYGESSTLLNNDFTFRA